MIELSVESQALLVVAILFLASAVPLSARHVPEDQTVNKPLKQQLDVWLHQRLAVANLDQVATEPSLAWGGLVGCATLSGWLLARSPGAAIGFVAALVVPVVVVHLRGDQTEGRIESALPDILEAAARNLRTGAPLLHALAQASAVDRQAGGEATHHQTVQHDIADLLHAASSGVGVAECFDDWLERRPFVSVRTVVTTIHVGLATGADLAAPLELAADGLRSRASLRSEVAALAAQAKASVVVIGLAPLAFLGVSTASGTSMEMLFGSPLGLVAMTLGLGLDVVGVLWMRRIIRSVTT